MISFAFGAPSSYLDDTMATIQRNYFNGRFIHNIFCRPLPHLKAIFFLAPLPPQMPQSLYLIPQMHGQIILTHLNNVICSRLHERQHSFKVSIAKSWIDHLSLPRMILAIGRH